MFEAIDRGTWQARRDRHLALVCAIHEWHAEGRRPDISGEASLCMDFPEVTALRVNVRYAHAESADSHAR